MYRPGDLSIIQTPGFCASHSEPNSKPLEEKTSGMNFSLSASPTDALITKTYEKKIVGKTLKI